MTDAWHRTADLVGLPGMPNVARPIRLHGAARGWISRQASWGKRTVLEWLESSLPPETQAALRGEGSSHPARSAPETGVSRRDDSAEGDGCQLPSPPSLLSDSSALAVADARTEILAAFNAWHRGSDLGLIAAMREWAPFYSGGGGDVSDETRELIPSVAWNTLQRWRADRREGGTAALMRGRGGRSSDVSGPVAALVEAMLLANPHHVTAKNVLRAISARFPESDPPGIASVRRFMARWRDANGFAVSAVADPDGHRSRTMTAFGDGGCDADALNQLWELDSTKLDVICSDGVRWDVCVGIDVWSRRTKGFVTQRSCSEAIAALSRRCLVSWGVPGMIRTDEGADYTSKHLSRVLRDLDVVHDPLPPYRPDLKPHVERVIGTMARDLLSQLPGFCGHDVADGQRIRNRKSFAARRGEDRTVTFRCDLTAEELQDRIDQWCDHLYGREPHSGLEGLSPFEKAASWTGPAPRAVSERGLDILLAPAAGDGRRKVGKDGIRVDGGIYIAAELGFHADEWIHVRQDPGDWGRIWVFTEPDADGAHAFICVAEDPARTGIDRREVAVAARRNWAARSNAARKRARELAAEHAPADTIMEVLDKAAEDAAKVVQLPRKAETHETAATKAAADAQAHDEAAPERRKRRVSEREFTKTIGRMFT